MLAPRAHIYIIAALSCAVALSLSPAAQPIHGQDPAADLDRQPWMGLALDGQRVAQVAFDSPAFRSGLRVDDRVLTVDGTAIATIQDLIAKLRGKRPGDELNFIVQRGDQTMNLTLKLGSRRDALGPMGQGGRIDFPTNDAIFPQFADTTSEIAERFYALLDDEQLNAAWRRDLAARRKALADAGRPADPALNDSTLRQEWTNFLRAMATDEAMLPDFYKPNAQSYVRRDPLKFELVARHLLRPVEDSAFGYYSVSGVILGLGQALDIKRDGEGGFEWHGSAADLTLDDLAVTVEATNEWLDKAYAALSKAERAFLATQLPVLANRFAAHIYLDANSTVDEYRANLQALALTKKIDYYALRQAGMMIASLSNLPSLAPSLIAMQPCEVRLRGLIISVNGGGDPSRADIIVNTQGNTTYPPAVTAPPAFGRTKLIIDVDGDDTYEGGFGGIAGAIGGVSVIIDTEGDDLYRATRLGCGAALAGIGILEDRHGNDIYLGDAYIGGAAMFGFGVLLDIHGNDTRKANLYAWGFAGPKGGGACLDCNGNDHSISDAQYPTAYGEPAGEYQGMSFGFAIGFRNLASGGVAMYCDQQGNDLISAGEFSIGGAYFLGLGIYHDLGGDDIIHSSRYGVGFGVHSACGIALDDAGDDIYQGQTAASLGSAWDLGVGMLIDSSGNDVYIAKGLGLGGAAQNGFALLWDKAGNDVYRSTTGGTQGDATGFEYGGGRGAKNFALLWDDAGTDSYNRGTSDGVCTLRGTIGFFVDRQK